MLFPTKLSLTLNEICRGLKAFREVAVSPLPRVLAIVSGAAKRRQELDCWEDYGILLNSRWLLRLLKDYPKNQLALLFLHGQAKFSSTTKGKARFQLKLSLHSLHQKRRAIGLLFERARKEGVPLAYHCSSLPRALRAEKPRVYTSPRNAADLDRLAELLCLMLQYSYFSEGGDQCKTRRRTLPRY